MNIEVLRELLRRRPFEPFWVTLSSGDRYEVRHPEMAWLTKTGLYVGLPGNASDLPEWGVFCALPHIAAVETLTAA